MTHLILKLYPSTGMILISFVYIVPVLYAFSSRSFAPITHLVLKLYPNMCIIFISSFI